jgi:hypothetical protein
MPVQGVMGETRDALALMSMLQWPKTRMLEAFETPDIRITGLGERFSDSTAALLDPIAPRVLVGVDDIPSRWAAQRAAAAGWHPPHDPDVRARLPGGMRRVHSTGRGLTQPADPSPAVGAVPVVTKPVHRLAGSSRNPDASWDPVSR